MRRTNRDLVVALIQPRDPAVKVVLPGAGDEIAQPVIPGCLHDRSVEGLIEPHLLRRGAQNSKFWRRYLRGGVLAGLLSGGGAWPGATVSLLLSGLGHAGIWPGVAAGGGMPEPG